MTTWRTLAMGKPKAARLPAAAQRGVWLYYAFQLFFNLLLWVPVFYEYQKRAGLSDEQIFGIQSIYYVVFCLAEIPTGNFADRYGYRTSLLAGSFLLVIANLLPISWAGYGGFLTHFLGIAVARSLISGAGSAYAYEFLNGRGAGQFYKEVEGKARFYSLVARVLVWAVVGYLMTWKLASPYWLSALNAAIAVVLAFALPKVQPVPKDAPPAVAADDGASGEVMSLWRALLNVGKSPLLVLLMMQGIGLFVLARILQVNLYQPVLRQKAFALETFGWIMSAMTVCEAVGSRYSHILKLWFSDVTAVTLATLLMAASILMIAALGQNGTMVGLALFALAAGLGFPIQKQLLNDAILDGRQRATILSLESIIDRAVCAVAVLPLGTLTGHGLLSETLAGAALMMGLAAVYIHRRLRPYLAATKVETI